MFDSDFRRLPQRAQDCPGVIYYVCASPAEFCQLLPRALKVSDVPADYSDHRLLTLSVSVPAASHEDAPASFVASRLAKLKVDSIELDTWKALDDELRASDEYASIVDDAERLTRVQHQDKTECQNGIDQIVERFTSCIHKTLGKYRFKSKRHFTKNAHCHGHCGQAAPEHLRQLQRSADQARIAYLSAIRQSNDDELATEAKRRWNIAVKNVERPLAQLDLDYVPSGATCGTNCAGVSHDSSGRPSARTLSTRPKR